VVRGSEKPHYECDRRGDVAATGWDVREKLRFSADSFTWGLQAICQLHRIPFAAAAALQQISPPYRVDSFEHAAQAFGLKCASERLSVSGVCKLPMPCLAVLRPTVSTPVGDADAGSTPTASLLQATTCSNAGVKSAHLPDTDSADRTHRLALLLRCDGNAIHYLGGFSSQPSVATLEQFTRAYAGTVLLFTRAAESVPAGDGNDANQAFGFKWFVPELLRHKFIWRDVLLASLAIQLLALTTPVFTQIIIDKVIVHHTTNTLIVIAVALCMFMVFTAGLSWLRQYLVLQTGNRIDAVLASRVFEHLFRLPLPYFENRPTGTLVARIQGVETIREFIAGAAVTLILDVPFLLLFLAIMLYYSWLLTLITLAVLLAISILSFSITPMLRERINNQFLFGARNQAFLTEYIAGVETAKSLQMEPRLNARYGDYLAAYLAASFRTRQLSNTYNVVANALEQFLTLSILCVGAWLVMTTQSLTIGMLVAFQMFASRLSGPMLRMVGLWQQFQQTSIAVKRLGDIMNAPAEPYSLITAREGTKDVGQRGRIDIDDLSFRYADNRPWLFQRFSLSIAPGQCVAVMGASGSGKSTLAKLLQGFYQLTEGSVKIDGYDIGHLPANELRRHFGVVPQDTTLFSGTVYGNLLDANQLAAFEQIIQACKMAEIHDFIEQLPKGYQTEIGEHGVGLSGGQKQRIAIARALLKRPDILIFDEATSSLDAPTAEQFARTVNKLKGKVTMIFIAHQLPKGLQVDSIVNLGTHEVRMTVVSDER